MDDRYVGGHQTYGHDRRVDERHEDGRQTCDRRMDDLRVDGHQTCDRRVDDLRVDGHQTCDRCVDDHREVGHQTCDRRVDDRHEGGHQTFDLYGGLRHFHDRGVGVCQSDDLHGVESLGDLCDALGDENDACLTYCHLPRRHHLRMEQSYQ